MKHSRVYNVRENQNSASIQDTKDKVFTTVIWILIVISTCVLTTLSFFGSVNNLVMGLNVYRLTIIDTTTFHDIPDIYPISLWNYCYGYDDIEKSQYLCINMKYGYYFDVLNTLTVQSNSLPSDEQINFTSKLSSNLNYFPISPNGVNAIPFYVIHVSFVLGILNVLYLIFQGIKRLNKKENVVFRNNIFEGISDSLVLLHAFLNAISAVFIIVFVKRYQEYFSSESLKFQLGVPWQVITWISVLLDLIALLLINIELRYRNQLGLKVEQNFNPQNIPIPPARHEYNYDIPIPPSPSQMHQTRPVIYDEPHPYDNRPFYQRASYV
ncbi:hypothetical protein WICMUC_002810 [Wickerhamomyces mucosus]|uniref:Uncharacterized protein n=1 Tax=Wickerhamomyces mucosus TaxID=1378264 RepID=A0A9P8TDU8_9ASCO|nr:hypothetical protein WICMUC_002810 [Wickerhamomyces mucosus]